MQKISLLFIILLVTLTSRIIYANDIRYVSDELHTYTRFGPGEKFKLAGTLQAGEPVTLLQVNNEARYAQIRDSKGKESWIALSLLSEQPSLHIRVPDLQQKVTKLTEQLNTINQRWEERTAEMQQKVAGSDSTIHTLQQENSQLKTELASVQKHMNTLSLQFDDKKRNIILQWFLYGGCVAGGGLLLGLLLPHLIPNRKNKGWMN